MRPYLILDTYLEKAGAAADLVALLGGRATHVVRPPFGDEVPATATAWAGLLLTGSAASATDERLVWLEPLRALVRDALARARPVFGICFGHQVLAQAALGVDAVRAAGEPELGWAEIEVLTDHPLLAGVGSAASSPRTLECFVSHFDEVCVEDGALDVFARTSACAVQAFQVPDRPAFGIQFHPEMPPAECARLVRKYLPRLAPRADPASRLARAVDGRRAGRRILENFFRLVGDPEAHGASRPSPSLPP